MLVTIGVIAHTVMQSPGEGGGGPTAGEGGGGGGGGPQKILLAQKKATSSLALVSLGCGPHWKGTFIDRPADQKRNLFFPPLSSAISRVYITPCRI